MTKEQWIATRIMTKQRMTELRHEADDLPGMTLASDLGECLDEIERLHKLVRDVIVVISQTSGARFVAKPRGPLWGRVGWFFCLGSTSSKKLCSDFGFDPETGEELNAES